MTRVIALKMIDADTVELIMCILIPVTFFIGFMIGCECSEESHSICPYCKKDIRKWRDE